MRKIFTLVFLSLCGLLVLRAKAACPEWAYDKKIVPACPHHGYLGNEYPAIAHVISSAGIPESLKYAYALEKERIAEVVKNILLHSGKNLPLVFVNVDKKMWDGVREKIDQLGASPAQKAGFKKSLKWVNSDDVNATIWVQDTFQSFNDPKTGKATLRLGESYCGLDSKHTRQLIQVMKKECPLIEEGIPLKTFADSNCRSGESGGNIEFLPRVGMCLRGDSQSNHFAMQYCTQDEEVVVPTSWLKVGHVDEYIAVESLRGKECKILVSIASYEKFLQLFEANRKEPLFDFQHAPEFNKKFSEERRKQEFLETIRTQPPFKFFCGHYEKTEEGGVSPLPEGIFQPSEHEINPRNQKLIGRRPKKCTEATMGDFLDYLKTANEYGSSLHEANLTHQKTFDRVSKKVVSTLKSKLPNSCRIVLQKLPQAFDGEHRALSFFPNPSNSIKLNESILLPNPANRILREHLQKSFLKLGIQTSFVSTFESLHCDYGNLHCAINTVRYCIGTGVDYLKSSLPIPTDPTAIPKTLNAKDIVWLTYLFKGSNKVKQETLNRLSIGLLTPEEAALLRKLVLEAMQEASAKVIYEGAKVLIKLGLKESRPLLVELYDKAPSAEHKVSILRVIRPVLPRGTFDALILKALQDENVEVLRSALFAAELSMLRRQDILPLVRHKDPSVRARAVQALGTLNFIHDTDISQALADADVTVQMAGVIAISDLNDKKKATALLEVATNKEHPKILERAYYIATRMAEDPMKFFRKALKKKDKKILDSAIYVYLRVEHEPLQERAAVVSLSHPNPFVRKRSAQYILEKRVLPYWLQENVFHKTKEVGKKMLVSQSKGSVVWPVKLALRSRETTLLAFTIDHLLAQAKEGKPFEFDIESKPTILEALQKLGFPKVRRDQVMSVLFP